MEDDNLIKRRQISKIFKENFQSLTVQQHHQKYLSQLHDKLNRWKSETNEKLRQFIKEKMEEINQFYAQYCQEMNEKFANVNQQIENRDSLSDRNDQIENFNIYCQSNTIENCIRLNINPFSKDQLTDNIQLEYILYPSPSLERTIHPSESPIKESPIKSSESPIKESPVKPLESLIKRSPIRSLESPIKRSPIRSLESPIKESPVKPLESSIKRSSIRSLESPIKESPVKPLESFIKKSPVESLESSIEESPVKPLESPIKESPFKSLESTIEESPIRSLESPIRKSPSESLESTVKKRTTEPLESITKERPESIHSIHTSSRGSPVPVSVNRRSIQDDSKYESILEPQFSPSKEEPFVPHYEPSNDNVPKSSTRLYIGKHNALTPVLIGKDREFYNESEKITEYSIDSIPVPQDQQEQSSNINSGNDNDITLFHAYKVLVQEENDHQQLSSSTSSDDEHQSNPNNKINLKNFDQINYSTIMFRKFETEYNCISSSTKRNELILYNSKLNILIILQHENHQQCRHRFYLYWPKNLSSNISDITYCQNNDHFLISTWDTSHIYLFNRDSLSLNDLGKLSNDLPLRRIHCYQETIYCIISNNYLLEYQIDEEYSHLTVQRKIQLFNPLNYSQDTVYHLLDITCDENYLIIIYSNEHDEIHLQSISRQTREFHQDILLDIRQPINQNYIRIESTNTDGNFIYLNGSQQHLKAIDLVNYNKGKITSIMRRHTKPTNICFLQDERLVILYENPYFLSVHDLNNRQQVN